MEVKEKKISASLEDYLEAILYLTRDGQDARGKDIAERLMVAKSSVTGALRLLREKGLVNYRPYGRVSLTGPGRTAAMGVARKHSILKSFFMDVLGVRTEKAQAAACRAEHALGPEIIGRLLAMVDFVRSDDVIASEFVEKFKVYCHELIERGISQLDGQIDLFEDEDENFEETES